MHLFPRLPSLPANLIPSKYTWRTAIIVAIICLVHGLAIICISATLILARPHHLRNWANALGIMATMLAAIQYLPQIWMTWSLGHVGSLSIPMMLIQTPGSFVWSASLAARLGLEGWSTWGVFLVTGCLQGCLLVMGICFEIKARRGSDGTLSGLVCGCHLSLCQENANSLQSSETEVCGYTPTGRATESDDEGNPNVNERTPLINGSKKGSTKSSKKTSGNSSRIRTPVQ